MILRAFFMFALLLTSNAEANPKAFCELQLSDAPEAWVSYRQELGEKMRALDSELERLARPESDVAAVGARLGAGAEGPVFSVETARGPAALKLYEAYSEETIGPALLLQAALGELGLSPRVFGILSEEETAALVTRFPALKKRGRYSCAVLMERFDGAWANKDGTRPADADRWDVDKILAQIDRLATVLGRLRVIPRDAQILITPEGRVYMHDLDGFDWLDEAGRAYGLRGVPRGKPRKLLWWRKAKPLPNHGFLDTRLDALKAQVRAALAP